ncbi:hypothetical protein SAMN04489761_3863 [Tenacibaculum sp. MAR_2009_124]|uniref:hypothetical protein n=1 Tax=Tenacibaculum sp. MAR_2009_124 TaxID=1250059 RepID=UPI00089A3D8E|nr:hypothetical protein [Tenacibaculum sp. MAR_2009_124]SEC88417.1 hypothetical protein SAMN04489761_3863 [Tenacibaculum sp. MAR_2009_124]
MKIRNKRDVEKLDEKIKTELGIDISKYHNEEVISNFLELLIFPRYILNWAIRPIFIALIAFILSYFLIDLVHIQYVLYTIIGFILFLLIGFLSGVIFLTWKIKTDILNALTYSIDILKSVVSDINLTGDHITKENRKDVLLLLFKGITHIITIPTLSNVISDKIPIIGNAISFFIRKTLTLFSNKLNIEEIQLSDQLDKENDESKILNAYINSLTTTSNSLENVLNIVSKIAQFPVKIILFIITTFLMFFIYLIH